MTCKSVCHKENVIFSKNLKIYDMYIWVSSIQCRNLKNNKHAGHLVFQNLSSICIYGWGHSRPISTKPPSTIFLSFSFILIITDLHLLTFVFSMKSKMTTSIMTWMANDTTSFPTKTLKRTNHQWSFIVSKNRYIS